MRMVSPAHFYGGFSSWCVFSLTSCLFPRVHFFSTGRPALDVLKEGLRDLRDLCNILEDRVEHDIPDALEENP